jgi:hypothetical protein
MYGYAKVSFTIFVLGIPGPSMQGRRLGTPWPMGGGGSICPPGFRTYVEARDRWLVKPIRTTRKDWTEPVRL